MRRHYYVGIACSFMLLGMCRGLGAPIQIAVSIPPLEGIAARLGGDSLSVSSVMNDTADPHTFSPSPRLLASLAECSVLFTVGVDFEAVLCDKLARMFPDLRVVNVAVGLSQPLDEDDHDHEGHDHLDDPHLWLSVPNLQHMATAMAAALKQADPANGKIIARNLAALTTDMEAAHAEFTERLTGLRSRMFYVYHPAFSCFARDYNLVQKAIEVDGKAPTPRQLAKLMELAQRDRVKVIFVQPQFPQRSATMLASRLGGRVVPVNPLSSDPVGLLRQAVEALSTSP